MDIANGTAFKGTLISPSALTPHSAGAMVVPWKETNDIDNNLKKRGANGDSIMMQPSRAWVITFANCHMSAADDECCICDGTVAGHWHLWPFWG